MAMTRRNFLSGFIAAPAVLRLGIYMPVKPEFVQWTGKIVMPTWESIIAVTLANRADQFSTIIMENNAFLARLKYPVKNSLDNLTES